MRDEILVIAAETSNPATKLNLMREHIQTLTLRSLHESEAFKGLAFVGGTALRFVHDLPRFSEDVDFSLHERERYAPEKWLKKVKIDLSLSGFNPNVTFNDKTNVHKAWIRIPEIMRDAGLAAMANQNLSIKLEIDVNPPIGGKTRTTLVSRGRFLLALRHYDLPSLMAGKLHALLTRGYPKGRDWYDFVWYRTRRPPVEPNLTLLQNALDQTGVHDLTAADWKTGVAERVDRIDVGALISDVEPFLEHSEEAELLTRSNLASLVDG